MGKARIVGRFGEGLHLPPAGRLSDDASGANVGGSQREKGLIWDPRKIGRTWQRNKVKRKAGQGGGHLGFLKRQCVKNSV